MKKQRREKPKDGICHKCGQAAKLIKFCGKSEYWCYYCWRDKGFKNGRRPPKVFTDAGEAYYFHCLEKYQQIPLFYGEATDVSMIEKAYAKWKGWKPIA